MSFLVRHPELLMWFGIEADIPGPSMNFAQHSKLP